MPRRRNCAPATADGSHKMFRRPTEQSQQTYVRRSPISRVGGFGLRSPCQRDGKFRPCVGSEPPRFPPTVRRKAGKRAGYTPFICRSALLPLPYPSPGSEAPSASPGGANRRILHRTRKGNVHIIHIPAIYVPGCASGKSGGFRRNACSPAL